MTARTAERLVGQLVSLGVLEEVTGKRRNRVFVAREVLELLEADRV